MQVPHQVRIERDGPVAIVTFARPEARNAWSEPMLEGFRIALAQLNGDAAVRAVVVAGDGPAFHAGGDLQAMRARSGMFAGDANELRTRYERGIQSVPRAIAAFGKPLLAAVHGAAIGAGLDLACMCDLRLAARGTRFGSTFVKLGLVPGDGGAFFLARTIGFPRALELMLTARLVDTDEALRIGLVHEVVEPDALLATARQRAHQLAQLPATALALTKRAAYQAWHQDLAQALELAATYQGIAQTHADHHQALGS
jgi:enoyl-CoA hydratase/carnithine racemase